MIFLDTSGIYALADLDDANHDKALRMFESAQESGEEFLTHSYVLVESAALIQRRLGMKSALAFLEDADAFVIDWVDADIHRQAVQYLSQHAKAKLSLVDAISFLVMKSRGVSRFIGFDKHFVDAGFVQHS